MEEKRQPIESVFSKKIRAGRRRTYFFDVRQTKGEDYYLTMTESTKRFNGTGYERHKIFLYKEDFNRFLTTLEEVINYVKTDLMPDFDYDEFTRRHEEYEKMRAEQDALEAAQAAESKSAGDSGDGTTETPEAESSPTESEATEEVAEDATEEASDAAVEATEDAPKEEDTAVENEEDMAW